MSGKLSGHQTQNATPQPAISLSQPGILQRTCECGGVPGLTGECEECSSKRLSGQRGSNPPALPNNPPDNPPTGQIQRSPLGGYSFGKLAIAPKERLGIQAKLAIGQPGDRYEQEADQVAEQVMRMPAPDALAREPLVNSNLPLAAHPLPVQKQEVKEEDEEKKKGKIQAKEESGQTPKVTPELEERLQASQGRGQPLPEETRSFMESRFGYDFSQVRVHANNEAVQMNRALSAHAFTHRQDIYFAAGKYNPESRTGKQLVAHELTHVTQQTGNIQRQSSDADVKTSETIKEEKKEFPPDFKPEEKAKKLYEAFEGWGTDERAVIDILWTGRQDMTQAIELAYNQLYSPPDLEKQLHEELSGDDLERALKLLGHGKLDLRDKVREVIRDIFRGEGLNDEKLFHALDRASKEEINALNSDSQLMSQLKAVLPADEWQFVEAYLTAGKGILAAKLRSAVRGWGTDEKAIWRALEQASPEEREFVSKQEKLKEDIKDDLSDEDWIRFERTLAGNFSNLDRIEMAALDWGTDEAALKGAIAGLTGEEFTKLANTQFKDIEGQGLDALDRLLEAELSGSDLVEARETLNQKRLAFDKDYRERYLKEQTSFLGDTSPQSEAGASVLLADTEKGESTSVVGKLKVAAAGAGTDEKAIWHVLNSLTDEQRRFIRERNPEGVLNVLREDLSDSEYQRAMELLAGGATSVKAGIKQAVQEAIEGWGTDKRLLYDAVDRAAKDKKVAQEILADPEIDRSVQIYVEPKQYQLFRTVLQTGNFTPIMRLQWATTAIAETDEDLVFELCKQYGKEWFTGSKTDPSVDKTSAVNAEVDAILKSELSTSDYWKALDSMRGEPNTEEERLARAKELLERERGGVSTAIMDSLSFTGENADDAWRGYRATYNRALEDGKISKEEEKQLRQDERYSKEMTEEYQEAKSSIAQWATSIAVAIVGVVATILTAGTAGPFVLALGGKLLFTAQAMILAAALKVGLNRAIQGEGYDVTSTEALVDAASAGVEVGLSVLGGQLAARFVQGASKTALVRSVGPYVQKAFGKAGTNIVNAGLEGAVDATIGGVGEGVLQGLANEKTWADGVEGFFKNMGTSVGVNALMSSAGGFIGGAGFKSIGEAIGPRLKGKVPDELAGKVEAPKVEAPKVPEAEAPKVEAPKAPEAEAPKVEVPKVPEAEAPKVEVPKAPEAEAPKVEVPKVPEVEAPKVEVPKVPEVEAPKVEPPKAPEAEAPKVEAPKVPEAEAPKVEAPKVPEVEAPKVEAPKVPEAEAPALSTPRTVEGAAAQPTQAEGATRRMEQLRDESQRLSDAAKADYPKVRAAENRYKTAQREAGNLSSEVTGYKALTKEAVERNPALKDQYSKAQQARKRLRQAKKELETAEAEYRTLQAQQDARYEQIRKNNLEAEKLSRPELDLPPMQRGRVNEVRVLKEEGLLGIKPQLTVRDPKTGEYAVTIPDAVRPNGRTVDVKDVAELSETQQLRLQREYSRLRGQKPEIITGTETKVPEEMEKNYIIRRRPDLGPR